MNGLHQLIMTLAALALVGNAAAFTTDEFMTAETYKSARAQYHVVGDTTWGSDVDVYTLAAVTLQWPTRFGDNDVTALQDSLLTQFFFHHDVDVDAAIASVMTHPLHYGEGTLEEVDEIPEGDSALVLEATLDVSTVGFCDRFIVYRADYYINEGGVHPNYFSQYLNYDIRDNQVLDYNDIFVANCDSALLNIVTNALCDRYYVDNVDELVEKADIYVDELFVSRDVYLTGHQIIFSYDPYDIAPWSTGVVEVPVYIDDIADYLTPLVRSLYNLD